MASKLGGKIELQGESEYRKALKDITSNLRLMSSELKLTNTAFTNGDKTVRQAKASYDTMNKSLQEQKEKVNEMRTALSKMEKEYGSNHEKVKQFKTQLNNAENQLKQMESATDKSTKELKEMKSGFDDAGTGALKFGDIVKANIASEAIIGGIKALGSAVKALGTAFLNVGKQAIEGYADFEQLEGGVKKLFGDEMAETVKKNANDAFKTAGMTANEYMETVTSFSASLIQSLSGDTKKATEYADMAIRDMSDNANVFGTDIGMIQNAYQGFAKGNYTMLDNLKLGYGGTKTEMERLLAEAEKMPEAMGRKFDLSNYADIVQAINVVQQNMKISGTTAMEASRTISGSLSATKSAWSNLITGLADDNANFEQLVKNLVDSICGTEEGTGLINQLLPRIEVVMNGIITMIPMLLESLLPKLLTTGASLITSLITGITTALPQLMPVAMELINSLITFIVQNLPTIISTGVQMLVSLINGIVNALPQLIPAIMEIVKTLVKTITENLPTILEAGIQILFALMEGIAEALPDLVPQIVNVIIKIMEIFNENFDKFLMLGIKVILGLIEGIIKSIPDILRNLPTIIMAIINFFTLSKFLTLGKTIISGLVSGLKNSTGNILSEIPKLVGKIINSFKAGGWKQVGTDIIKGICNGLTSMGDFILNAVKKVGNSMLSGIKKFFGIKSPSRLMKDEVGTFLAEGIGVGFTDTMTDVSRDMTNAIPTEFDTNVNMKSSSSSKGSSYDTMVNAFKQALTDVKVVMNDREMGTFVTDTMERVVYS